MITPSTLQQAVQQQQINGINCVLISNNDGRIVSYAGGSLQQAKALAAIIDNSFFVYNRHGSPPQHSSTNQKTGAFSFLIDNKEANIVAFKVSQYMISMVAGKNLPLGYLYERAQDFATQLVPVLS